MQTPPPQGSSMSVTSDPILNMLVEFWDPYLKRDIDMLESVQKFALPVCSKQWNASCSILCSSLNLPTLAAWRKQMKLARFIVQNFTWSC